MAKEAGEKPMRILAGRRGRADQQGWPRREGLAAQMTDWGKIGIYGSFIRKDPFRMGLHFPAVLEQLGDARKRILDVGCNDGLFPGLLAARGAAVLGYDRAPE